MAKIQLTIKVSYLPGWGIWEAIREAIQNAKDAEVEHGAPMTIDWYNDTLRIENEGITLPTKALLFGHTTKLGNREMIGKFGEGLKLFLLVAVRAGHPVKIRNGDEVWVPVIERSETFDEDVLAVNISGGREQRNRVRVEIGGISKEAWEKMREMFLFVNKPKADEQVTTNYDGTLLLGEKYKGRVYVKGIFVQHDPDLSFGYDLRDVELDRDRKMVESWNLRYYTRQTLLTALTKKPDLFPSFYAMLEDPTRETQDWDATSISEDVAKQALDAFTAKHGPGAVPVASLAESKDVEHLGKRGVVVSKPLGGALAKTLGDALSVKEGLRKETTRSYGWGELSEAERATLTDTIALVNGASAVTLDEVDIVDFRSPTLEGQFKDGRVLIAKRMLGDFDATLCVLVHEVAHRAGGDGDKSHVAQIEDIWMKIVRGLRRKGV